METLASRKELEADTHPEDEYLRAERIPHIWCAGCGIGVAMTAYIEAMKRVAAQAELQAT